MQGKWGFDRAHVPLCSRVQRLRRRPPGRAPETPSLGKGGSPLCMGPTCPCGVQPSFSFLAAGPGTLLHPAAPTPDKAPPNDCPTWCTIPSSCGVGTPTPALQLGSVFPSTLCRSSFFVSCPLSPAGLGQRYGRTPSDPGVSWRTLSPEEQQGCQGACQRPPPLASVAPAPT